MAKEGRRARRPARGRGTAARDAARGGERDAAARGADARRTKTSAREEDHAADASVIMVRSGRWTRRMVPCRTGAPPPTIREFGAGAALVALPKTRTRGGARKGRLSARSGVRASVRSTSPTSGAGRDAPGRLIPAAGCENASSKEPRRRRLAARRHVATLLELIVPGGLRHLEKIHLESSLARGGIGACAEAPTVTR